MSKDFSELQDEDDLPGPSELDRHRAARSTWSQIDAEPQSDDVKASRRSGAESLNPVPAPDKIMERRIYDYGKLGAALDGTPFDDVSRGLAVETGLLMAHALYTREWAAKSTLDREDVLDNLVKVSTEVQGTGPSALLIAREADLRHGGWSNRHAMAVAEHVIENEDPRQLIEVVAHESRHQWQDAVIGGEIEHPRGASERLALADARDNYLNPEMDLEKYLLNRLELDAEAFARTVVQAFEVEDLALRKIENGQKLANIIATEYSWIEH